jgi:hypothetical protein
MDLAPNRVPFNSDLAFVHDCPEAISKRECCILDAREKEKVIAQGEDKWIIAFHTSLPDFSHSSPLFIVT